MHRQKWSDVHPMPETQVSAFTTGKPTNQRQIRLLARKPLEVEVKHPPATSAKKQRFSSEDFAGFYSPSQNLTKKIDINRVLPRTPSKGKNQEAHTHRHEQSDQNVPAAVLLAKTPPTRSQLRVRLKLSEISNDAQVFKQTERYQAVEAHKPEQQKDRTAELQKQVALLTEQNAQLRGDIARQLQVNNKVHENMQDTLKRFTEWQHTEQLRQERICQQQKQLGQLKGQNQFLTKNLQSKTEVVNYLHQQLSNALVKLEQLRTFKQMYQFAKLQEKISCLQQVIRQTHDKYQRQQQRSKYLEIELRTLKQKQMQQQGSLHQQQRELLIEKNRRLKRQAVRLKSQLVEKFESDELFELSP